MVWGPGGVGKIMSINALSIAQRLSVLRHRHAVPFKIACKQVNFLRNHHGTKSVDELLSGENVAGM